MNGIHKVVHHIIEEQNKLGHNSVLWGISKNTRHDYPERTYITELFKDTGKFGFPEGMKTALLSLPKETVFHFHGGFVPQYYRVSAYLQLHGFKYIFTPHGSYNLLAMQKNQFLKKVYCRLFERLFIQRAKSLHFVGESEVGATRKIASFDQHFLIPNGQVINSDESGLLKRNENKVVFGFCGRLVMKTKGLDLLLKGFADFVHSNPVEAELKIIGDGKDRPLLEKMALELGLENKVHFLGKKLGKDKQAFYESLDYLVLCSRNEGLPGVILEASSLGIPCIVSKATNLGRYINRYYAGIVLKENTISNIGNALLKASYQKEENTIHKLGNNARNMISDCFNWNTITKKLMRVYAN